MTAVGSSEHLTPTVMCVVSGRRRVMQKEGKKIIIIQQQLADWQVTGDRCAHHLRGPTEGKRSMEMICCSEFVSKAKTRGWPLGIWSEPSLGSRHEDWFWFPRRGHSLLRGGDHRWQRGSPNSAWQLLVSWHIKNVHGWALSVGKYYTDKNGSWVTLYSQCPRNLLWQGNAPVKEILDGDFFFYYYSY